MHSLTQWGTIQVLEASREARQGWGKRSSESIARGRAGAWAPQFNRRDMRSNNLALWHEGLYE